MQIDVKYYLHSGFSLSVDRLLFVFDYWLGENAELPPAKRITNETLKDYDQVYVFISHSHPDHFDPVVYDWGGDVPITYFISYDLPGMVKGTRLQPGDLMRLNSDLTVRAFESTDLGVSFLLNYRGFRIFHAGDLNFWHWREESTVQEIDEADEEFRSACEPLKGEPIDLCFFPVDPRQGRLYDAGASYFMMTMRPRLFVPMHYWGRTAVIEEFARRNRTNQTEIVVLSVPGERMGLEIDDEGYMTVHLMDPAYDEDPRPSEISAAGEVDITGYDGSDPFFNSDEPVDLQ